MSKKLVSLRNLVKALRHLGFTERSTGSHSIFLHPDTGLIVTLPTSRKDVPPVYFKAISRQIVSRGIMSEVAFMNLIG